MNFTRSGKFSRTSTTTNTTTGQVLSTYGFYGSSLIYTASGGDTTLTGSDANEAFIYDLTLSGTNALRFSGVTTFDAGGGDDIMDFTVRPANAGHEYGTNASIYGGLGNDVIWTAGGELKTVTGDNISVVGTSSSDMAQGGNDTIDLSAATAGTTVYGDAQGLSWARGGADTVTGSAAGDFVYGDGTLLAAAGTEAFGGNDTVYGKAGADSIYGDAVNMGTRSTSKATGGDDVLYAYDAQTAGTENDFLWGEGNTLGSGVSSTVTGGNDTLYGSDGNNTLYGDAGTSAGSGSGSVVTGGADTVYGRDGTDTIYGDAAAAATASGSKVSGGGDTLFGDGGDDTLYGDFSGVGIDSASSQAFGGTDNLSGGAGTDTLIGDSGLARAGVTLTCGNDRLDGGNGNDQLYGDVSGTINAGAVVTGGNDTFVFQPGSGADTIYDFGQTAGSSTGDDLIDVSAYGYTSFSGLSITGNGTASVVVDFGGGNSVTVQNKANTALTLDASDFIFAA